MMTMITTMMMIMTVMTKTTMSKDNDHHSLEDDRRTKGVDRSDVDIDIDVGE